MYPYCPSFFKEEAVPKVRERHSTRLSASSSGFGAFSRLGCTSQIIIGGANIQQKNWDHFPFMSLAL